MAAYDKLWVDSHLRHIVPFDCLCRNCTKILSEDCSEWDKDYGDTACRVVTRCDGFEDYREGPGEPDAPITAYKVWSYGVEKLVAVHPYRVRSVDQHNVTLLVQNGIGERRIVPVARSFTHSF